mmetsp:Transcript_10953/g.18318  ORF Transcript_10953/g.18318 Transcript_10953/m.18318 type:complete len:104 (-) Transcript_10953:378-689(-)
MVSTGNMQPNESEERFKAKRVEGYKCEKCGEEARFPRYNDPIKLLETRTGRCGEWANAFSCICVGLGHETRRVLDWTDHVWTEVYVHDLGRWVHLDSCEPIMD